MKRRLLGLSLVLFLIGGSGYAEAQSKLTERVRVLERQIRDLTEEVCYLGEVIEEMTKASETIRATFEEGLDDPIEPGEIKVIKGTPEILDACDSIAAWEVQSGTGVTISLENENPYEGTGCMKISIPANTIAIVTCTFSAKNLNTPTDYKYLKAWLKRTNNAVQYFYFYFGETTYNEQQSSSLSHPLGSNNFREIAWDISDKADTSKDAITKFSIRAMNTDMGAAHDLYVDYCFGDTGPSRIVGFDGDRLINLYPKFYTESYIGDGVANRQITIPRKGTPSRIQIDAMDRRTALWSREMVSGHSKKMANDTGDGSTPVSDETDCIKSVGDCYFTVGTDVSVNGEADTYYYSVWWDD